MATANEGVKVSRVWSEKPTLILYLFFIWGIVSKFVSSILVGYPLLQCNIVTSLHPTL